MGSTLNHLQQWCNELIQQALGDFRDEQDRTLQTQCESLQAEQQRLARKHSEIAALAERLVAQRQSSDDQFASRAASLERRACDIDAFMDELAREQTNHVRCVQEIRAEMTRLRSEQFDTLKAELAESTAQLNGSIVRLQQDVQAEFQGIGQRFDARIADLSQRSDFQERALGDAELAFRSETERHSWLLREYQQDMSRFLHGQLQEQHASTNQHLLQLSGMQERVHQCGVALQDSFGKDREKAEASLADLVHAMDNIRQYTGKYADTFAKAPLAAPALTPPSPRSLGSGGAGGGQRVATTTSSDRLGFRTELTSSGAELGRPPSATAAAVVQEPLVSSPWPSSIQEPIAAVREPAVVSSSSQAASPRSWRPPVRA